MVDVNGPCAHGVRLTDGECPHCKIASLEASLERIHDQAVKVVDDAQEHARHYKRLIDFVVACSECKSAATLYDFVVSNIDKVLPEEPEDDVH